MSAGHSHDLAFDGLSDDYRRRLFAVIAIFLNSSTKILRQAWAEYTGKAAPGDSHTGCGHCCHWVGRRVADSAGIA